MQLFAPMLAKPGSMPKEESLYGFEIKWDGIRALVYIQNGVVSIRSRNNKDLTAQYPELASLGSALPAGYYVLDGEIIAFGADQKPSFAQLQHRMGLASPKRIAVVGKAIPVNYILFDVLVRNDQSLLHLPYTQRRIELEILQLSGSHWQTPSLSLGGSELLAASRQLGLEGIMAKKLDSPYVPGKRTGDWIKIKNQQRQELVIGGWTPGEGSRQGMIGSLLVGYYDKGYLQYAGAVGTGFTIKTLNKLLSLLTPLQQQHNPFTVRPPQSNARFVAPQLVGEFEFTEWTPNDTLRHPSFKGLRQDKNPLEVTKE